MNNTALSDAEFWKLLDNLPRNEAETELEKRLKELSLEELGSFICLFTVACDNAYSESLWAAAYIINGGCSDDSFIDFRYGLISCGQAVYQAALNNPDTLANLGLDAEELIELLFNESFGYVAGSVYEEMTGEDVPDSLYDTCSNSSEPQGESWDFDNEELCAKKLPKLWSLTNCL